MAYAPTALYERARQTATDYSNWLVQYGPIRNGVHIDPRQNFNRWFRETRGSHARFEISKLDAYLNFVRRADVQAGQQVVELGSGTAVLSQLIADRSGIPGNLIIIDRDQLSLDIAQQCFLRRFPNGPQPTFLNMDFSTVASQRQILQYFNGRKAAVIVASYVVSHFQNRSVPDLIKFALALGNRFIFDYIHKDLYRETGSDTLRAVRFVRNERPHPLLWQINANTMINYKMILEWTDSRERNKTARQALDLINQAGAIVVWQGQKHTLPPANVIDQSADMREAHHTDLGREEARIRTWATIEAMYEDMWDENPITPERGVPFRDDPDGAKPEYIEVGYLFEVK